MGDRGYYLLNYRREHVRCTPWRWEIVPVPRSFTVADLHLADAVTVKALRDEVRRLVEAGVSF